MNKSLFFSLFLLISVGVCAQTGFENTSNLISIDSARTKKTAIKIYPNPSYGKLSVTASTASPLHFYVFDMEGTLVFQAVFAARASEHRAGREGRAHRAGPHRAERQAEGMARSRAVGLAREQRPGASSSEGRGHCENAERG